MSFVRFDRIPLSPEDLLQGDVSLASPPEIYARLRKMVNEPGCTTGMLSHLIEHDPALSARILRVANSAFYALPGEVTNITDAVGYLGIQSVQDLVLATEVIQRFSDIPEDLVNIYSFWRSSLRCAVLARQMATASSVSAQSEQMFIAGLLHRIGHLVMYRYIPELARKTMLEHRHRQQALHLAERDLMGFDYADLGAALVRLWKLPPLLDVVIAHQWQPGVETHFPGEAALMHLALSANQAASLDESSVKTQLPQNPEIWERAGLSPQMMPVILGEAEQAYHAGMALLN